MNGNAHSPKTIRSLARLTARAMSHLDCRVDTATIQAEADGTLVLTADEAATVEILLTQSKEDNANVYQTSLRPNL